MFAKYVDTPEICDIYIYKNAKSTCVFVNTE